MAGTPPYPTPVFHVTHIDNVPRIMRSGGLRCVATLRAARGPYIDIAHQNIQDRRAQTLVPCGPRGCLQDYVPFYFGARSPMLYAIHRRMVATFNGGQEDIVYLVAVAQEIEQAGYPFVFTDGHATVVLTDFFHDLSRLGMVDWRIVNAIWWNETVDDPDRKRRKQAEFLIHQFLPWNAIRAIGTFDERRKVAIEALLAASDDRPAVLVRRQWYY